MTFLLDVNALLALGFVEHEFHARVSAWLKVQRIPALATCSITELGFVRILSQTPLYGLTVARAQNLLLKLKKSEAFIFLPDDHDISRLPAWVKYPRQTTEGHLLELARANQAVLATLDERMPGAHLIR